ncbi:hypothetical protein Tco_1201457 [Tanacetum coccineum]
MVRSCKIEDVHDLRSVETEFPAIVFNDTLTSEAALSCEPTVISLNNDEIDFRISFDESDDEDCTVIFDKNSFSYKIISINNLKTDSKNDNDKVNMPLLPSPKPTVSYFDDLDFSNTPRIHYVCEILVYGGNPEAELRVDCYCDAGFETDRDDTKSQTGHVFVLNGGAVD